MANDYQTWQNQEDGLWDPNSTQPQHQPAQQSPNGFDQSRVPAGVTAQQAQDFLASNPGDYDRMGAAFGQPSAPPQGGQAGAPMAGAGTPPSMGPTSSSGSSSSSSGTNWSPQATNLWDVLWGRSQQNKVPDRRDPIIAAQVGAYGAQQERGSRNYLNEMAERGGPTANMQGERRMASEHNAQATGGLQATLMQNEVTARRQEIQNALSQMGGMLSEQERRQLEEALGMANLGLQASDRANYWDALRSGLL